MASERIGSADSVPPGEVRVLRCASGRELAVSNIEGTLYAIDDVCTHDGGTLAMLAHSWRLQELRCTRFCRAHSGQRKSLVRS
jgi:nitrite reductase/ring-hydroxylating ferredoxin subunit